MIIFGYPFVKIQTSKIVFHPGRFINLPKEYIKVANKKLLQDFYIKLLSQEENREIHFGTDPLGFTYLRLDFICYIGLVISTSQKGKYKNLHKKYADNKFPLEYLKKQIQFEYDLINFKEYIPIEVVTQNLHELRGLNSKISNNIDRIMNIESEDVWEQKFEEQSESIKKIYVGSRLIKFILDNIKFYIPDFFENLKMNHSRTFVAHRSVSKIVKIYRNDFKKDRADIDFTGYSTGEISGDKEYFEVLIKILIENALKYSEYPKRIGPKVDIKENKKIITIEVHSYGRAIPQPEQPYLFSKGFRASINSKSKEGTGMGLYNAKQLAKHFNAEISFYAKDISNTENFSLAWNIFKLVINKSIKN